MCEKKIKLNLHKKFIQIKISGIQVPETKKHNECNVQLLVAQDVH